MALLRVVVLAAPMVALAYGCAPGKGAIAEDPGPELLRTEGWSARALRYALLAAHYRAPLEFNDESLAAATSAVERLSTVLAALDGYREERADDPEVAAVLDRARATFESSMDDDLAIAPALGAAFELVRDLNRRLADRTLSTADAQRAAAGLRDLDRVLGVMEPDEGAGREMSSTEVAALLEERVGARAAKDWVRSDSLRDALARLGVVVEDTRDGQRWKRMEESDGQA